MDAYSLNHPVFPGKPLSRADHHKTLTVFVIVTAIAAALSIWYLVSQKNRQSQVQPSAEDALHAEVASLLAQAPVNASPADIDKVTALLSQSDTAPNESEREAVAKALSGH